LILQKSENISRVNGTQSVNCCIGLEILPRLVECLSSQRIARNKVASSIFTYRCSGIQNVKMVWRQRSYVTNNVDQQTLKSYDDYVLPHQLLWTFDVLVCPLSVTERFLLQPVVCGTVFHRTSLLPPLSIFCCHLKSHLFLLSYPTF